MERSRIRARDVIIIGVLLLLCFSVGFLAGGYSAVKVGVHLASGFIEIDEELVKQAIFQYQNNIGSCFPPL